MDKYGFSLPLALLWSWCCCCSPLSFAPIPFHNTRIPRSDGPWLGFGSNGNGQLGLGDNLDRNTPTAITALGTGIVESCAMAGAHTTICKKYVHCR